MLFEIAVVQNPLKKDAEENGTMETLVLGPVFHVAKDQSSAALKALRAPEAKDIDLDRCTVLVRPFV